MSAGEHRHRVEQRLGSGLFEEVGQHEDEGALPAADGAERELVVRVDHGRLHVEHGAHDGVATPARRGQATADAIVEGDDPGPVTHLVGDERHRGGGVDRGVEAGAVAERRCHETAGVEHAHDVAVLLHPVLVAHGPAQARRRAPVDLADVVVGEVVADRLEVGAEPERAPREAARVAEATLADRENEPPRRR